MCRSLLQNVCGPPAIPGRLPTGPLSDEFTSGCAGQDLTDRVEQHAAAVEAAFAALTGGLPEEWTRKDFAARGAALRSGDGVHAPRRRGHPAGPVAAGATEADGI